MASISNAWNRTVSQAFIRSSKETVSGRLKLAIGRLLQCKTYTSLWSNLSWTNSARTDRRAGRSDRESHHRTAHGVRLTRCSACLGACARTELQNSSTNRRALRNRWHPPARLENSRFQPKSPTLAIQIWLSSGWRCTRTSGCIRHQSQP